MKRLLRPAVWSNVFYLVPLVAALWHGLWGTATAVGLLLVCSFAFHLSRERRFVLADWLAAAVVAFECAALLLISGLNSGYVLIAAMLAVAGLFVRYRLEAGDRGGVIHALWHLLAATVILASIFSYVR